MDAMSTDAASDTWPCVVCGELAAPDARSDCYRCGDYFHLRLTTTAEGPDCGDVWIDDEVMALQFACRNCLDGREAEASDAPDDQPSVGAETPRPRAWRASAGASARDLARRRR